MKETTTQNKPQAANEHATEVTAKVMPASVGTNSIAKLRHGIELANALQARNRKHYEELETLKDELIEHPYCSQACKLVQGLDDEIQYASERIMEHQCSEAFRRFKDAVQDLQATTDDVMDNVWLVIGSDDWYYEMLIAAEDIRLCLNRWTRTFREHRGRVSETEEAAA